jgi:hypothetical protein
MRNLRSLAPDYFLGSIWTSQLSTNVYTTLAGQPEVELDRGCLPDCAREHWPTNRQHEAPAAHRGTLSSGGGSELSVTAPAPASLITAPGIAPPVPGTASPTTDGSPDITLQQPPADTTDALETGRKIVPSPAPTASRQTSPAAHVCATVTGRLFITDKSSKQRFLIDTGLDLCVFPRKLIPRRKERVNYDLCTANVTIIPTYGWLPLSLDLGLRRDFTWRFIGADFLSFWSLSGLQEQPPTGWGHVVCQRPKPPAR